MAKLIVTKKAVAENPLKSSTPLGAALAFLGIEGAVPLFHGSQGCTSFGLVLAVRHFKEAIPLQTTAMNEPATVLGGFDNIDEAIVTIANRMKPKFIGVASTALVETRAEDLSGAIKWTRKKHPDLNHVAICYASTPDFEGALEDGFCKGTKAVIEELTLEKPNKIRGGRIVNVLPGVHDTPGTIEEVVRTIEAFGLKTRVVPDISTSLDGWVPDEYIGTSLGGALLEEIADMGDAFHTIALSEHMRPAAEAVTKRTGVPHTVLPSLLGLAASDEFIALLAQLSGEEVPAWIRRERSRLVDAMLDGHFHLAGRRLAIGSDPDLLYGLTNFFSALGARMPVVVTSTKNSPLFDRMPCESVLLGDIGDLEDLAKEQECELLVTHSHGNMASEELNIPLFRVGFPIFDRIGHAHRSMGGYIGTRQLIFEVANIMAALIREAKPDDFPLAIPPDPVVVDTREEAQPAGFVPLSALTAPRSSEAAAE